MLFPKIHRNNRLPRTCSQPAWRNWLVTSVAVSADTQSPAAHAPVRSAGTTPQRAMNASRALSPLVDSRVNSQAQTSRQATTRARVTSGVRRVGLASRSGIIAARPGSGLLGRFRAGLLARLGARRRARRGVGTLAVVAHGLEHGLADVSRAQPHERRRRLVDARQDVQAAQVLPVRPAAGEAV